MPCLSHPGQGSTTEHDTPAPIRPAAEDVFDEDDFPGRSVEETDGRLAGNASRAVVPKVWLGAVFGVKPASNSMIAVSIGAAVPLVLNAWAMARLPPLMRC